MKKSLLLVLTAAAALSVGACNRGNTLPEDTGAANGGGFDSGAQSSGSNGGGGITESPLEAEQRRLMQQLVVYFDYDTADILPQFNALLAAHGQFLARNP